MRSASRLPLALLVPLCSVAPVHADEPTDDAAAALAPAWQIESFLEDADLAGWSVLHFDFAADGVGWFATSHGLLRYDGFAWERFTTDDGLPSDYVRAICVAGDGRLWVGTDRGAGVFQDGRFSDAGTDGKLAGPSVRRIVETSDGALWFCCDRWPEAKVPSGLTRRVDGVWTTWTAADGLPSDYVSDVFEASDGRVFVLTNHGLALYANGAFVAPLVDADVWAGPEYVWSMVESPRHGLLVATADHFYQERAGNWRRLENEAPSIYLPKLGTTPDGEVLACHQQNGRTVFLAFDGECFVPVAEPVARLGQGVELVRADASGGVWVGGFDRLIRWNRAGPGWSETTGFGAPLGRDADGGLWFLQDDERLVRLGERREEVAGSGPPLFDPAGPVWFSAPGELRRYHHGEVASFALRAHGFASPRPLCIDARGGAWACDWNDADAGVVRVDADGTTEVVFPLRVDEQVADVAAHPDDGIWLTSFGRGGGPHRLLFLDQGGSREVDLPVRTQMTSTPKLFVDRAGRLWTYGFFGAYFFERGWQRFEGAPEMVSVVTELGDEHWLVGEGHLRTAGGVVRQAPEGTTRLAIPRARLLGANGESFLVSGAELRPLRAGIDGTPAGVVVPTLDQVAAAALDADGALWVRAGDKTLRRTFGAHDPRAVLVGGATRLVRGERLELTLGARHHGHTGVDRVAAVGSWALDGGAWSAWADLREPLVLDELPVGEHVLLARVRDGAGHVSAPLEIDVRVAPVPLQQRSWFLPLVGGTLLALGSLAFVALRARGALTAQKAGLEQAVERRTAEARASERRYRTLFEQARDAVLLFHLDGSLSGANRSAHALLGDEEGLPGSIAEVFATPEDAQRFQDEADATGEVGLGRFRVRARNGEVRDVLLSAKRWFDEELRAELWQLVLADVTELVRLEEELRQTDKMDALGRMAGGVAHDFNNLLTVILGFAEVAQRDVSRRDRHLSEIIGAATRAKSLVQQIQLFGRSRVGEAPAIDASETIASIAPRLRVHLTDGVELTSDVPRDLGWVRIDPAQLEQALVNLVVNASHAMPDGGRITLRAHRVEADTYEDYGPSRARLCIDVRDEGCGMDADTLSRAFEPFFTTKPVGRGTGLGLAIVYGVVQLAHGHVTIESRPGAGTRVRLLLPFEEAAPTTVEPSDATSSEAGAHERVLVVDDEPAIAEVVEKNLISAGYDPIVVADAAEALALLERTDERIDLLLTDVVMPGTNGVSLVRHARALRPDLAVVVVSGYPRPEAEGGVLPELDVPFLGKPFRSADLLAVVRQALDGRRASAARD